MNSAACVLLLDGYDNILCVSRKDDHNDWGLPGGKCEDGETPENAALRETFEETGYELDIYTCDYFVEQCGDYLVYTYLAIDNDYPAPSRTDSTETGLVEFRSRSDLEQGSFGEYNKKCFKYLLDKD